MEDTGSDQAEEKLPNQKIQRIEKSGIVKRPSSSHPIYGLGGIMEGILVDKRGPTRTYIFDPPYRRTSPKAYGHNNLAVGKWFPLQIKALADGAHGDRMAGISVGPEGPYSIVASSSGEYEAMDQDKGDILYYCGSGSHENELSVSPETRGTKNLLKAEISKRPIRVLRAGGRHKGQRPKSECGIRYDGLSVLGLLYNVQPCNSL